MSEDGYQEFIGQARNWGELDWDGVCGWFNGCQGGLNLGESGDELLLDYPELDLSRVVGQHGLQIFESHLESVSKVRNVSKAIVRFIWLLTFK